MRVERRPGTSRVPGPAAGSGSVWPNAAAQGSSVQVLGVGDDEADDGHEETERDGGQLHGPARLRMRADGRLQPFFQRERGRAGS